MYAYLLHVIFSHFSSQDPLTLRGRFRQMYSSSLQRSLQSEAETLGPLTWRGKLKRRFSTRLHDEAETWKRPHNLDRKLVNTTSGLSLLPKFNDSLILAYEEKMFYQYKYKHFFVTDRNLTV